MTTAQDDRIDRIEDRVDRMEHEVLEKIYDKLNALEVMMTKTSCPAPGACIGLTDKLMSAIASHDATMLRVERLELQLMKLLQERAYILGGCAVVATFFSIVGVGIGMVFTWILNKQ